MINSSKPIQGGYYQVDARLSRVGPISMAVSLKCASTAISKSLEAVGQKRRSSDLLEGDICLFARNPIDRLRSAFQWFYFTKERLHEAHGTGGWKKMWGLYGREGFPETWEGFVDLVLSFPGAMNPHWYPQVLTHTHDGVFLPTRVYRLEHLRSVWPSLVTVPLLKNKTVSPKISVDMGYRRSELESLYSQDMELWHGAE